MCHYAFQTSYESKMARKKPKDFFNKKNCLNCLDCTLFLILFCTAIIFIWQGVIQYISKATSFQRAERNVNQFPTITFCLVRPQNANFKHGPPFMYEIGKNFNISYAVIVKDLYWVDIPSVGKLYINVSTETIYVEQITTKFICYKINSTAPEFKGHLRGIKINFLPSIESSDLPLQVDYTLSSEDNAYTVLFDQSMNGDVLRHYAKMGYWAVLNLKTEKFIYLKETSQCVDDSFWKLWEPFYSHYSGFENCPKKCAAISLPNNR